jgi:ADP-ribosylglycohydrolase
MRPPATGADDAQADAITRVAPLVSMFAGDARLMQLTAAVTRVTQDTATAVAWACAGAAVLERVLMGQRAAAAVRETAQELRQDRAGKYTCVWSIKVLMRCAHGALWTRGLACLH